jgi:hypothetical protein
VEVSSYQGDLIMVKKASSNKGVKAERKREAEKPIYLLRF